MKSTSKIRINGVEWRAEQILQADLAQFPSYMKTIFSFLKEWFSSSCYVSVKTSGSTGTPKEFFVEKSKMVNSALMTCQFFGLSDQTNALLCMSAEYIAGKMMLVRAIVSGMNLICIEPNGNPLKNNDERIDFLAIVPMQLYNILQTKTETESLNKIKNVIVGGGKIHSSLLPQIKCLKCNVWATYGMTETLSHIALRKMNGNGASDYFSPLEGVNLSLSAEGTLRIVAPLVCDEPLQTNDVANINADGTFEILGRIDNVVCSGGVKIQIEKVEDLLQSVFDFPFAVTSVADEKFSEALVLLVVTDDDNLKEKMLAVLPKYWMPKHIFQCEEIPLTATGKPDRVALKKMANLYHI